MSNGKSHECDEKSHESESDDDVDPLSADEIFRLKKCTHLEFEIYKDYQHIRFKTPILGSIGEFCGAFYHVPGARYCCLDENHCQVGKMVKQKEKRFPEWIPPKTVAALVKYEIDDGSDMSVCYSNHYILDATKHAEEFFSDDIEKRKKSISDSKRTLRKITMYITFQPCHLSTINKYEKSCCNVLLNLLEDPLKNVEICIKPTHIHKAGNKDDALKLVENGEVGIKKLMAKGVKITRMEEADWNFLYDLVDMNDDERRNIIPPYSKSSREALDMKIDRILRLQCRNSGSSGSSS